MPLYHKKPEPPAEAWQFTIDPAAPFTGMFTCKLHGGGEMHFPFFRTNWPDSLYAVCLTYCHSSRDVRIGDWIIRNPDGSFSSMRDSEFRNTYDCTSGQ